ncbi:MAG: SDR family NAD(P)-dependent oxidoreductase [Hyphomicrobiaceae bacterium]
MAKSARKEQRTAVVTGAGSGIGQACAETLLEAGWTVAFLDVNETALAEARERHAKAKGARFATLDVTDESAVERAIAEINRETGGIHGVVNSAGIALNKSVLEVTATEFRRVLDVNVVGTFLVGRAAARVMRDRSIAGAIVNIASISGIRGSFNRAAYGASKGGVITLTKVMANELAPLGIRVNAVAPGPVETAMVKAHHKAEDRKTYARTIPMNRYAEPVEIARAAEFLLDPTRSGYITAEVLAVDGGYRGAGLIADRE